MGNPYKKWVRSHITTPLDLDNMNAQFHLDKPKTVGGDTETTGLHIKKDKAFLIVFGWLVPGKDFGRVFTFYPTQENMNAFFRLAKKAKYFVWHNTKYDLHMLSNIGYEKQVQDITNLCENMAVARLTLEAVPVRDGGDSLALKDLGKNYVHPEANKSEGLIKQELRKLDGERIKVLTSALKQFPLDGEFTPSGKQKYWGKGAIEKFLKEITNDLEDLPKDVREVWEEWQKEYPKPTYEDVNRDLMIKYAGEDVITMLEFFKKAYPTLVQRNQLQVLERENKAILPLFRMERVGMKANRKYLEESRVKVKNYIKKQRKELHTIAGEVINSGQHARIIQLYHEKWNVHLDNADKKAMKSIAKNFEGEPKRFAELVKELRTLEKWYSTYIVRLISNTEYDGRAYTQIHQCSAVSGRVGSDFQQFPKDVLKDEEGKELFHPRKPFIPSGGGYKHIYYLDYSQVELRVAANYTILVSGGDINLCRAYFPFKMSEGDWTPTDIHAETTKQAYPNVPVDSDEFKELRGKKGKVTNFLCLYGGTPPALASSLDIDMEEAIALHQGYQKAFPQLQIYSDEVVKRHRKLGYVTNMYGRRYYLKNPKDAYKLANYLIQGTCADALKEAIIKVDTWLQEQNVGSRFQMNIHDELSFEVWTGEEWIIPHLVKLMEDFGAWCKVPIKADVEVTETNWAEKQEVNLKEIV